MSASAFRAVLARDRELFNHKFVEARRRRPDLDAGAFGALLSSAAAPVVESAAAIAPDRADEVAHAAYDAALTLIGERLAGPGGRHPILEELWIRLLPKLASLVADQPARVIASLTNAAFNLASTPGARPAELVAGLEQVAPLLASVGDLLRAGELVAWRAGLAHFRERALEAGDRLPAQVASALLGAPRLEWSALRARLASDAWYDPAAPEAPRPRIVRSVGGFRGFGGGFLRPPRVFAVDGQLAVSSNGECWFLTADSFGATFHRADPKLYQRAEQPPAKPPLVVPGIGAVTSVARVERTVAITGDATHAVALVAVS
jgi:hypothetical protein